MTAWKPSLGAIPGAGATAFRVWAPKPDAVRLVLVREGSTGELPMSRDPDGYWSCSAPARPGDRYGYLLDDAGPFPDPCSRSQPDGVDGLSEVVDPTAFPWTGAGWSPPPFHDLVVYECHVATFTPEGTFDALAARLPYLAALGTTALELMPVADFPGRWNWGYDGVAMFAPSRAYGGPDALRRLVDAAHRHGIAVILDVVYNHFGPAGNYAGLYGSYVDDAETTPWGAAIAFVSPAVRQFYRENLLHWLHEYHLDGFRFDATHALVDRTGKHILAELSEAVAEYAAPGPRPYLIAESHENDVRYLRPVSAGGFGFDAVWVDDFHHAVRTLLCRDREGYFANFEGSLQQLAQALTQGFLYEGQRQPADGLPRGTPARDVPWASFVYCLQNHDQVGNRAFGERLAATAAHADVRAASMLLLLLPQVPMLFQGQEFFAASPFQYFTDHEPGLGSAVTEGRRREFAGFSAFSDPLLREAIPDPQDPATFQRSKLNWGEATAGIGRLALEFHRAVLAIRDRDAVLRAYRRKRLPIQAAVEGRVLVLAFESGGSRRWLVANFGEATEVVLADGSSATVIVHSDEARFGGSGGPVIPGTALAIPAHTAAFLASAG